MGLNFIFFNYVMMYELFIIFEFFFLIRVWGYFLWMWKDNVCKDVIGNYSILGEY